MVVYQTNNRLDQDAVQYREYRPGEEAGRPSLADANGTVEPRLSHQMGDQSRRRQKPMGEIPAEGGKDQRAEGVRRSHNKAPAWREPRAGCLERRNHILALQVFHHVQGDDGVVLVLRCLEVLPPRGAADVQSEHLPSVLDEPPVRVNAKAPLVTVMSQGEQKAAAAATDLQNPLLLVAREQPSQGS